MYGLPKDFDGSFLVGQTLEQVCFTENQVYLHFGLSLSIVVESAFSHGQGKLDPNRNKVVDLPISQSNLMKLLGHSVSKVTAETNGTLRLIFENGATFACFDNESQYECYKITRGNDVIIV